MYCIDQQNAIRVHKQLLEENQEYAAHLRVNFACFL